MAGDWIKMRTDMYRDPRVCIMADALMDKDGQLAGYVSQNNQCDMSVTRNVMRNVTVGALVTVWGVMRMRGKRIGDDLVCLQADVYVIDDMADLPGFGKAMELVGWVKQTEKGVVFPNFFEEYNVDPLDKKPSSSAERQRRYRERNKKKSDVTRDVTRDVTVTHREENSREDKKLLPAKRGTRLPDDWKPSKDELQWAMTERTDIAIGAEVERFRDYWIAQPGAKGVKLDWSATWRNWVRNARHVNGAATTTPTKTRPFL